MPPTSNFRHWFALAFLLFFSSHSIVLNAVVFAQNSDIRAECVFNSTGVAEGTLALRDDGSSTHIQGLIEGPHFSVKFFNHFILRN